MYNIGLLKSGEVFSSKREEDKKKKAFEVKSYLLETILVTYELKIEVVRRRGFHY